MYNLKSYKNRSWDKICKQNCLLTYSTTMTSESVDGVRLTSCGLPASTIGCSVLLIDWAITLKGMSSSSESLAVKSTTNGSGSADEDGGVSAMHSTMSFFSMFASA